MAISYKMHSKAAVVTVLVLCTAHLASAGLLDSLLGGSGAKKCSNGASVVKCARAPCKTDQCKAKCRAAGADTCVNNYCGSCGCDCCISKYKPCQVPSAGSNSTAAQCCSGTICAQSTACLSNPLLAASCPTVCVPPAEAAANCKAASSTSSCNLLKPDCCPGAKCTRVARSSRCTACKALGAGCITTDRDCCPFSVCKGVNGTSVGTCAYNGPAFNVNITRVVDKIEKLLN